MLYILIENNDVTQGTLRDPYKTYSYPKGNTQTHTHIGNKYTHIRTHTQLTCYFKHLHTYTYTLTQLNNFLKNNIKLLYFYFKYVICLNT